MVGSQYMVYHATPTASVQELCGHAEWTMHRIVAQGFAPLLTAQGHYLDEFWRGSDRRFASRPECKLPKH
jgi:hypothetical protein